MLSLLSVFSIFLSPTFAHIVGHDSWCVATSPVHFECFYLDRPSCMDKLIGMKKVMREEADLYQCAPYPIDFRNFPKSGETQPELQNKTLDESQIIEKKLKLKDKKIENKSTKTSTKKVNLL